MSLKFRGESRVESHSRQPFCKTMYLVQDIHIFSEFWRFASFINVHQLCTHCGLTNAVYVFVCGVWYESPWVQSFHGFLSHSHIAHRNHSHCDCSNKGASREFWRCMQWDSAAPVLTSYEWLQCAKETRNPYISVQTMTRSNMSLCCSLNVAPAPCIVAGLCVRVYITVIECMYVGPWYCGYAHIVCSSVASV